MRRTKIVATVGPACDSEVMLKTLIEAGVNVFRLNFSHGSADHHQAVGERIRKVAAELGTMRVTEQIDALRTLATHPVDYLVVPRLLAALMAMPILTVEAIVVGIAAGYMECTFLLGIDPAYTWYNMVRYTTASDMATGLIKSAIFGGIVAVVGCYKGLNCREGAEGVGQRQASAQDVTRRVR